MTRLLAVVTDYITFCVSSPLLVKIFTLDVIQLFAGRLAHVQIFHSLLQVALLASNFVSLFLNCLCCFITACDCLVSRGNWCELAVLGLELLVFCCGNCCNSKFSLLSSFFFSQTSCFVIQFHSFEKFVSRCDFFGVHFLS